MKQGLDHWADIFVVVLYFVIVMAVGVWSLCRPNRSSVKGYFLAGRDISWFPVGASLFASNIGSEHFIGLAGTGAANGIAIVLYEWMSMPLVLILTWLFLPVYMAAGVFTLPEYLEKRFGGKRLRVYLSVLAVVLYVVTKIAVAIFAGALFIQLALGWNNLYLSILLLLVVTGLFTVLGGLAAVIYTDTLQTIIMLIGAVTLMFIGFSRVGGYDNLTRKYMRAVPQIRDGNSTCGEPPSDAFSLFRDAGGADNPWPGLILQSTVGCLWYWCADQVIVQRALAAKSITHAKGGAILSGYLKILPLFIIIFPGMISRALFPDEVACVDPAECQKYCQNPVGCSNIAYPKLVMELLPIGLRGLLTSVMLAAIMSSLTSIFNSASALFTMDIWRRFRSRAGERELLVVGRVFIIVLSGVSILWVPLVESSQGGQLFVYIQAIQGYLGTPIGALFLLAILWKRMTEKGAFCGILVGHALGITRMVLDFVYPAPACGQPDTRPLVVSQVHFTYYSPMIFVITGLVVVLVSLITTPLQEEKLAGLTWWTRKVDTPVKTNETNDNLEYDTAVTPINIGDQNGDQMGDQDGDQDGEQESKFVCDHNGDVGSASTSIAANHDQETGCEPQVISKPAWKRWIDFACGMPTDSTPHVEITKPRSELLAESKRWSRVVNINAIIGLTVLCFMWGYYH